MRSRGLISLNRYVRQTKHGIQHERRPTGIINPDPLGEGQAPTCAPIRRASPFSSC